MSTSVDKILSTVRRATADRAGPTLSALKCLHEYWHTLQVYLVILQREVIQQQSGREPLRILDFDTISPVFWHAWLDSGSDRCGRFGYAYTARQLLNSAWGKFTVLPGSVVEIADAIQDIAASVGEPVTDLRRLLGRALDAVDSTSSSVAGARSTYNVLADLEALCRGTCTTLAARRPSLNRVASFLNHADYVPWTRLWQDPEAVRVSDLQASKALLDQTAPEGMRFLNYVDALNASVHFATGLSPNRPCPVFVTSRASIRLCAEEFARLRPSARSAIEILAPVSPMYLAFAVYVSNYYEGSAVRMHNFVVQAMTDLQRLLDAYSRYLASRPELAPDEKRPMHLHGTSGAFAELCRQHQSWERGLTSHALAGLMRITEAEDLLNTNRLAAWRAYARRSAIDGLADSSVSRPAVGDHQLGSAPPSESRQATLSPRLLMALVAEASEEMVPRKGVEDLVGYDFAEQMDGNIPIMRTQARIKPLGEPLFRVERQLGARRRMVAWRTGLGIDELLRFLRLLVSGVGRVIVQAYGYGGVTTLEWAMDKDPQAWIEAVAQASPDTNYLRLNIGGDTLCIETSPPSMKDGLEVAWFGDRALRSLGRFAAATMRHKIRPSKVHRCIAQAWNALDGRSFTESAAS